MRNQLSQEVEMVRRQSFERRAAVDVLTVVPTYLELPVRDCTTDLQQVFSLSSRAPAFSRRLAGDSKVTIFTNHAIELAQVKEDDLCLRQLFQFLAICAE